MDSLGLYVWFESQQVISEVLWKIVFSKIQVILATSTWNVKVHLPFCNSY